MPHPFDVLCRMGGKARTSGIVLSHPSRKERGMDGARVVFVESAVPTGGGHALESRRKPCANPPPFPACPASAASAADGATVDGVPPAE